MSLYGLIGYPLSHSFSKKYFTNKFEEEHISECVYENFSIPEINELNKVLALPDLLGLNVTIPYKEVVLSFLHHSSEIVKKIGACNCIKILDGKLYGFNTDAFGFENSLVNKLDPEIHHHALILGTGGSSKAVKFVLEKLKIKFTVVSRDQSAFSISYDQVTKEIIQQNKLIINTTPLGMFPNVIEAPDLPYDSLTPEHYLFDLIYNPEKTLFLKKGEDSGTQIQNGYEMLVLQAEKSWEIWNNPVESLTGNF